MDYNIKYKNNNINISIDDNKSVWINNNIFKITFNDIIITVIIDNKSTIWFDIDNTMSILKYDKKLINKKYLIKHLEYDNKTKFINKDTLYKIINKCIYKDKKTFLNFLDESIDILLKNSSCLYSNDTLIKTTNFLQNHLYRYIKN